MFESSLIPEKAERTHTVAFALILQTIGVAALTLAPLLSVAQIDATRATTILMPLRERPEQPRQTAVQQQALKNAFAAPRIAVLPTTMRNFVGPRTVVALAPGDPPPYAGASMSGTASGTAPSIPGGDLDGTALSIAPPRPQHPQPVHLTSTLAQSQLLSGPKPEYPKLALASRTEGVVRLQATIATDGTIKNLHVVEGNPLLTQAALDAVERWRYRPMVLNGERTEVITEIDVHFTLHNQN